MDVVRDEQVELAGGRRAVVRLACAEPGEERLVDLLVDIDLQSFVESTVPRAVAEVVLHHGRVYVLEVDGDAVGTCLCLRDWSDPDTVVLTSMGLLPGWRGRGLGHRMLEWVVDALADDGVSTVSLHVDSGNRRAVTLYQEAGFRIQREGADDPWTGSRPLVMRRPTQSA